VRRVAFETTVLLEDGGIVPLRTESANDRSHFVRGVGPVERRMDALKQYQVGWAGLVACTCGTLEGIVVDAPCGADTCPARLFIAPPPDLCNVSSPRRPACRRPGAIASWRA
jgi:hypothetical protein